MFRKEKIRRSFLVATDAYITEMLRAILKDRLKTEVYLTQVSFKAAKPKPCGKGEIAGRDFAHSVMNVDVNALFTSLDFPRRHGFELTRGGVMANSANVYARFSFTNDAAGWYNWKLWSVHMVIGDYEVRDANGAYTIDFEKDLVNTNPLIEAGEHLTRLAKELQYRGPSRLRDDE